MEEQCLAEKIRPELLSFLHPDTAPLRILVVESLDYLPRLGEMYPRADLYVATAEIDACDADFPEGIHWQILDYLSVPLP